MELKEAIEKLANESVEYADIAENVLEGKGKVAEDCREYVEAIRVVLNHLTKQEKMIDKMADEILELNTMIVEKEELFSVVPMWLGKEHIIEYFKGITNKKD